MAAYQILNAMNLLWAFEFKPAKDSLTGIPVPVDVGAMEDVRFP